MNYRTRDCGGRLTLHEPAASCPKPRPAAVQQEKACQKSTCSQGNKAEEGEDTRGSILVPGRDGTYHYVSQRELEESDGRVKMAERKGEQQGDRLAVDLPYAELRKRFEKQTGGRL